MDQLDKARRLGALVADLSSAGAQLAVSEDGKRMGWLVMRDLA